MSVPDQLCSGPTCSPLCRKSLTTNRYFSRICHSHGEIWAMTGFWITPGWEPLWLFACKRASYTSSTLRPGRPGSQLGFVSKQRNPRFPFKTLKQRHANKLPNCRQKKGVRRDEALAPTPLRQAKDGLCTLDAWSWQGAASCAAMAIAIKNWSSCSTLTFSEGSFFCNMPMIPDKSSATANVMWLLSATLEDALPNA